MKLEVGLRGRFEGQYISHWEVPRFVITHSGWRGFLSQPENCQLVLSDGLSAPGLERLQGKEIVSREDLTSFHKVVFEGQIIEKGAFGHKGWCHWRILVEKWESVEEIGK